MPGRAGDSPASGGFGFGGRFHSFAPEDVEQVRRSIALLQPKAPSGLDRDAAIALIEELQRLQTKDRRVIRLLAAFAALLDAARDAGARPPPY